MKKISLLTLISIIALVGVVVYTGFLIWQRSSLQKDLKVTKVEIGKLQEELLQDSNTRLLKAISAKKTVNQVSGKLLKWSEIIKDVRAVIPERKGKPLVMVSSYSGSQDGSISLNVKTMDDSEHPYIDVADFIRAFTKDSQGKFAEAFVPSISGGENDRGVKVLNFILTTKYVEQKEDLGGALTDVLDESLGDSEDSGGGVAR